MSAKKISVIIPAYNEEKFIGGTIDSIKKSANFPLEIIVVSNGSTDKTSEISKKCAVKILNFPEMLGPGVARNKGAESACGDIFIFLDADTEISANTINEIVLNTDKNIVGVCSACAKDLGKNKRLRTKIFLAFKNFIHKTKFHKGSVAIIFCGKEIFLKINGFDREMRVGELNDFIKRAVKAGATYKFLKNCQVKTSFRRYRENGYVKIFWFWVKWRILFLFKKEKKLAEEYFNK